MIHSKSPQSLGMAVRKGNKSVPKSPKVPQVIAKEPNEIANQSLRFVII